MKKLLVALAAVCAAGAVMAGGVSANPDAGTVIRSGFECAVLDGNGNAFITTNSSLTLYANKVVLRCSGNGAGARAADALQLRQHRAPLQHGRVRFHGELERQGRLQRELAARLHGPRRPRCGCLGRRERNRLNRHEQQACTEHAQ